MMNETLYIYVLAPGCTKTPHPCEAREGSPGMQPYS